MTEKVSFPIALVGAACRFPGANDLSEFWSLLASGIDAVGDIPEDRWDVDAYFDPDPGKPGKMYTRAGGFISDIDKFDALFFGISPREARRMDPQQRLLLELTWEALENGGIVPARIGGTQTGVFVGISVSDYATQQREEPETTDPYVMSGSALSIAANRISYIFDLHGPSFAIDTACSSSLVAVHEACASLWRGESSLAIAAGVSALLSPSGGVGFSKAHMLSPSGHCHPFDAEGDGYVRSEGAAVVILQPLSQALAEGNPISAVILGSGVNSDGRTIGLAMPNQAAQEDLLRQVYRDAGVDPAEVAYIEAHGTGTSVGDPVECGALGRVIGQRRVPGDCCPIGSVKGNIGHLEPASGLAGLLKVMLALRYRAIPRTLYFNTPNPQIPFAELNLRVVSEHTVLGPGRLTMGVNSFGFGGTNAHIILQEPESAFANDDPDGQEDNGRTPLPLFISARDPDGLKILGQRYVERLRQPTGPSFPALCRNAAIRRTHHPHRLAVFGGNPAEAADRLAAYLEKGSAPIVVQGEARSSPVRLAFVFSGNGSQWRGMGKDLCRDPAIAASVAQVDDALQPLIGWSVGETLRSDECPELYDRTEYAQPALFALQVAIVEWLRAHGVDADAVIGHSVGEVAAAFAAGCLTLDEACRVIAERSIAQGRTAGAGRMAALGLSPEQASAQIAPYRDRLTLAAINAPNSVTVAGDADAIASLGAEIEPRQIFFRPLDLDYAFHSACMDPIREPLLDRLAGLTPRPGDLRFVSTVSGGVIDGTRLDASYWWDNIRQPVRFAEAIGSLAAEGFGIFLEIGPHPILDGYLRECLKAATTAGVAIATLRRHEAGGDALRSALASCYAAGAAIDYDRLYPYASSFAALPTYPWRRERYWFTENLTTLAESQRRHPLLGKRLATEDGIWQNRMDPAALPWLADHSVQDSRVLPGTACIEIALASVAAAGGTSAIEVEGLEIRRPVVIAAPAGPLIEAQLAAEDASFRLYSGERAGGQPPVVVGRAFEVPGARARTGFDLGAIRARLRRRVDGTDVYRRFLECGLVYGPAFQGVAEIWANEDEALGRIQAPAAIQRDLAAYHLHPALLDACLQTVLATISVTLDREQAIFMPSRAERIRFFGNGQDIAWCHVRRGALRSRSFLADYVVFSADGAVIAEIDGLRLRRLDLATSTEIPSYYWHYALRPSALDADSAADLPGPCALAAELPGFSCDTAADHEARTLLDCIAAAYVREAFDRLVPANTPFHPSELLEGLGLAVDREAQLSTLLTLAQQAGMATRDGRSWRLTEDAPSAAALWREAAAGHPAYLASLLLLARAGENLDRLLRSPSDTAHPAPVVPGFDPRDQLADSDPVFRRTSELVAAVLRKLLQRTPAGRFLRILESAGGTGALAAALNAALPADRVEYVFTDPHEESVAAAEMRLGRGDVSRKQLDLGKEPGEQGVPPGQFDVVIANCWDRSCEPGREHLGAVHALLKPGGLLVLLAPRAGGFRSLLMAALSDRFDDRERDWRHELAEAGFAEVVSPGEEDAIPARAFFLARKPATAPIRPPAPPDDNAPWLVFAAQTDSDPVAAVLRGIEVSDRRIVVACAGGAFERLGLDRFVMPSGDRAAYAELFRLLRAEGVERAHLLHLRALGQLDEADPLSAQKDLSLDVLVLVQALMAAGIASMARLTVVTCGAMPNPDRAEGCTAPGQAPVWGVVRTIGNECPDLVCRLIDLDATAEEGQAVATLVAELCRPDDEDEVLLRQRGRYVPRLMRGPPPQPSPPNEERGFRLALAQGQAKDGLELQEIAIPRPAAEDVVVQVRAAGVNFRDVLQRIGLLPEDAFEGGFAGATLGMEFAGEVLAVGEDVEDIRPGDAVFGLGRETFSSHVAAPAFGVFKMPAAMNYEEATTLPVAAATAYYALHHMARLQQGERILIQGAAGGVGLAAIQYAQSVGAEIFAAAGSADKRALLRRLGVPHIVDSRSLAFADQIREITGGDGVDVVLNSVAGEAMRQGLAILRPFGRFVELGKRDFYANSKLGLQPFRNNIQFIGVDLDQLLVGRPALARQLFTELKPLLGDGLFRPLPHRVFAVARAAEAFTCMQHSRHIGKIVLTMDRPQRPLSALSKPSTKMALSADGLYLVTGGRGGFGLATAAWLANNGARHLALLGRSSTTAPQSAASIDRLRRDGVAVHEFALDVADADELFDALRRMRATLPPLRGIFHCAAVISDAGLSNMTPDNFWQALRPKIAGAWNLHLQTGADRLDFFVLYSSATTLFGNAGQTNYVAGNLYLEALADYRRGLGLPGLAVAWGAIGEVGHLAQNPDTARLLEERLGVTLLSPDRALARLEEAMQSAAPQLAVAALNWPLLARLPSIARAPKYALVRDAGLPGTGSDIGASLDELRKKLEELPPDEAIAMIRYLLIGHIAGIVGLPSARLSADTPLLELGMDSLMLVELRVGLEKQFGVAMQMLDLVDMSTIGKLAERIVVALRAGHPKGVSAPESPVASEPEGAAETALFDTLERLIEEDLDRAQGTVH